MLYLLWQKHYIRNNQLIINSETSVTNNLIEKSPIIRFLWKNQEKWPVEYVSKNVKNIFGYTKDDFLSGKVVYGKIIYNEDLQRVTQEVTENSKLYEVSFEHKPYRIICKTGKIKWIKDITLIRRNENEEITHYEGIIIDITEQKNAEIEILKLSNIVETTPIAIVISDINRKIEYVNSALLSISKYPDNNQIIGQDLFMFTDEKGGKKLQEIVFPLLFANKPWKGELSLKRQDGSLYPAELLSYIIFDANNQPKYLIGHFFDITERKNNEIKLQNKNYELIIAKQKAEESNQLKTEFINNMSHEIRTPMNGILGFSNFLETPNLSNEKRKHYINIIKNSGNQLMRIIDDILEISQLGTKQVKSYEKEICLNDLLLELFSIFDIKAKENKTPLYLSKGLADKESIILTDKTKLNKIISNLLENALKFTNTGFIEFGYQLKVNELEIYVKDTGIGIKPESQKIIFERFSQEEKKLSRNVGGLGLGLSIAKENAELLGGKITLQSEKGEGATFYVTIPYKPVNFKTVNDNSNTDKTGMAQKQDKYTILIVEDEEVNYLYIDTLLEDFELNLITLHAKHGKEAVEMCKENSEIDFVLMDMKMPIMNGFEATKLIKEFRPNLPIVAQTAYSTRDEKEQAFSAGCDDFISKPISEETLNGMINKYLITNR